MKINNSELIKKVNQALAHIDRDEWIVGIRIENKARQIGDLCECSKDNEDREDERDFPEYGTEEYENLPDLPGTSSYDVDNWEGILEYGESSFLIGDHVYLIGGVDYKNGPDDNEYIIKDAQVLAIII